MDRERELSRIDTFKKVATLGGKIQVNKDNGWMYFGNTTKGKGHMSKEKLFGIHGPLHPGMPYKEEVAMEATQSDTKATLIRELIEQSHFTRREAEETVYNMIQKGELIEVDHPDLGKVLVFRGGNA